MSMTASQPLPSTARLLKATVLAAIVAGVVLITTVLPAEYGIDPTGIGARLGLDVLPPAAPDTAPAPVVSVPAATAVREDAANAELAARAEAAFGREEGQSFDAHAVSLRANDFRRDTFRVTLPPGKGAEVKMALKSGDGVVFHWTASGDVALDMHGERPGAKGTWTSYAVATAQREASGTFIAPFDGSHGWYWQNRGTEPVIVEIEVAGFQPDLHRP